MIPSRRWFVLCTLIAASGTALVMLQPRSAVHAQQSTVCPAPAIPDGSASAALAAMRDANPQDMMGMRQHAWSLVTDKLLDADGPVWRDWCAMTSEGGRTLLCPGVEQEIHQRSVRELSLSPAQRSQFKSIVAANRNQRFAESLGHPRQLDAFHLSDRSPVLNLNSERANQLPSPPLLVASETLLDPSSKDVILKCFGDNSSPSNRVGPIESDMVTEKFHLQAPDESCLKNFQLPGSSIAVKTVWAITANSPNLSSDHTVNLSHPIPVWEPDVTTITAGSAPQAPQWGHWNTTIPIGLATNGDPDKPPPCVEGRGYYAKPSATHQASEFVPIDCFFSFRIKAADWNRYVANTAVPVLGPRQDQGSQDWLFFILIGFHVTTKELPGWTWQSFWWSGDAASDPVSPFQKPNGTAGAIRNPNWSHYRAEVTFGPPSDGRTEFTLPITFNPYLEAILPNGIHSNCYSCHNYALFHTANPECNFAAAMSLGLGTQRISGNCAPAIATQFCETGSRTDFLWSLADINVSHDSGNGGGDNVLDLQEILRMENFIHQLKGDSAARPKK